MNDPTKNIELFLFFFGMTTSQTQGTAPGSLSMASLQLHSASWANPEMVKKCILKEIAPNLLQLYVLY